MRFLMNQLVHAFRVRSNEKICSVIVVNYQTSQRLEVRRLPIRCVGGVVMVSNRKRLSISHWMDDFSQVSVIEVTRNPLCDSISMNLVPIAAAVHSDGSDFGIPSVYP